MTKAAAANLSSKASTFRSLSRYSKLCCCSCPRKSGTWAEFSTAFCRCRCRQFLFLSSSLPLHTETLRLLSFFSFFPFPSPPPPPRRRSFTSGSSAFPYLPLIFMRLGATESSHTPQQRQRQGVQPPTPQAQPTCYSLTEPSSSEHLEPNNKIPSPCRPGTETTPVEVGRLLSVLTTAQYSSGLAIPPQPSYFDQRPDKTTKSRAPTNSRSRHNSASKHLYRVGPADSKQTKASILSAIWRPHPAPSAIHTKLGLHTHVIPHHSRMHRGLS